jgi:hypothetical protein
MTMQYDVKAVHLNASGAAYSGPLRAKGYQIAPGGTAGQIIFYDNASAASGTQRLIVDITTNTTVVYTLIPGEGIRFDNGLYISLPASATITVFYG